MATKKYYILLGWSFHCSLLAKMMSDVILPPVASADTTALSSSFQDNETGHFYVEVRVDQMKVQGTETVKGDKMLSWSDVFLL